MAWMNSTNNRDRLVGTTPNDNNAFEPEKDVARGGTALPTTS
jgi:hypothetical protein